MRPLCEAVSYLHTLGECSTPAERAAHHLAFALFLVGPRMSFRFDPRFGSSMGPEYPVPALCTSDVYFEVVCVFCVILCFVVCFYIRPRYFNEP